MNAAAPALLVAQAVGRVGNYFNQELFGKPSALPWALEISPAARSAAGIPAADLGYGTFQPSFLYEMIFDLALAAFLVWLGRRRRSGRRACSRCTSPGTPPTGSSRRRSGPTPPRYLLGLRLNFFTAIVLTVAGLAWFIAVQRRGGGQAAPASAALPAADISIS